MNAKRIAITQDPLADKKEYYFGKPAWPARWVGPQTHEIDTSLAFIFRLEFSSASAEKIRIHLSADQRYELFLDGEYVGRGVERSDLKHWIYESYELTLIPGKHLITVRLWWVSATAPAAEAQISYRPAILLYAEGDANERISTGVASWEYRERPGYSFVKLDLGHHYFATGVILSIDGERVDSELDSGRSAPWYPVRTIETPALVYNCRESRPWWILRPAALPPMYENEKQIGLVRHVEELYEENSDTIRTTPSNNITEEQIEWQNMVAGRGNIVIPAKTKRRIIIDLENYYCVYPAINCNGEKATVTINFAESFYEFDKNNNKRSSAKGNRDVINGKYFFGFGFKFTTGKLPYLYQPHVFCAGRYIEMLIITAEQSLTINSLMFTETHFPYRFSATFASSHKAHAEILPIAFRTLLMCSHDTSMDCPYYERLNYVGDTRLQSLVAYVAADEDALARKCIELFNYSRSSTGLTLSRYPTRTIQTIPPFSLWWIAMVHDFACWRDDMVFVQSQMPGVRAVIEHWLCRMENNGLLSSPDGWNFVDWVPEWKAGIPSGGSTARGSFSSILNLHMVYTLRLVAELEDALGETELAKRDRDRAAAIARSVMTHFFDKDVGIIADDLPHKQFSEHAQCLAILSKTVNLTTARLLIDRIMKQKSRAEATIYFQHYLFEALMVVGRTDIILEKLSLWESLSSNGFCTTFECPEPSRSDCHAWGAHPVYHFLATIAGIRPDGFGFKRVIIRPQPASLSFIKGKMPFKGKHISFDLDFKKGIAGNISLPSGISGELQFLKKRIQLKSGNNTL
jgi:hypothetical protein